MNHPHNGDFTMSGKRYFTEDPILKGRYNFPSGLVVDVHGELLTISGEPAEIRTLTADDCKGLGMLGAQVSPAQRGR